MADDSMEISSDHGHNDGDGDIDIDFDFTSAHVDEDYVLEDAALTTDFGEDLRPQPSPAIGNDDLMVDEDAESYPMDDADLLHGEEGQTIDHEALHFDNDDSRYLRDELNPELHFEGDGVNSAAEYMYAHQQTAETQIADNDATEEYPGGGPQQESGLVTELISVPDAEKPSVNVAQHESRTASPLQGSPKSTASSSRLKSPQASNLNDGPYSQDHTSEHHETNITSASPSGDVTKVVEATAIDNLDPTPHSQDVIVVYRSTEYALFSSSDLDDPDSFFLSDTTIADKPLADLFKAIRLVIQEELTDEEELCIAVEDLGIETDEQASTSLYDITLTQILNLREKLLRNDGVESSRPLCLLLGTRTRFSKRIEKLTAGAAEGKGLSQLVNWDEQSESIDDLENANEKENGVEPTPDSDEVQHIPSNQDADAPQPAHTLENHAAEELAQENEYQHEPRLDSSRPEATEHAQLAPVSSVSGDPSTQHYPATDDNQSILQNATEKEGPSKEFYDEDDLIDYSEEEGDSAPTVQKNVKAHSTDESRSNQEYEAINEDLRRRSVSRTAEDTVSGRANNQAQPAPERDQEGAYIGENSVQYEGKSEHQGDFPNSDLNAAYENFTTGEVDATGSLEHYDGAGLSIDEFGGGGDFAEDSAFGDSFDVFGTEAQEYNYGDEGTLEDDDIRHQFQDNEPEFPGAEPAEASEAKLQQADTAESSVTVDADEIQYEDDDETNDEAPAAASEAFDSSKITGASPKTEFSIPAEHEDEIGYDDEDGVDKEKGSEATTPPSTAPIMPSSNGKRSRADTESDDATSMRGKEAKRPRS